MNSPFLHCSLLRGKTAATAKGLFIYRGLSQLRWWGSFYQVLLAKGRATVLNIVYTTSLLQILRDIYCCRFWFQWAVPRFCNVSPQSVNMEPLSPLWIGKNHLQGQVKFGKNAFFSHSRPKPYFKDRRRKWMLGGKTNSHNKDLIASPSFMFGAFCTK